MTTLKQRLARLEARDGTSRTRVAWIAHDETQEQARARWCAENPSEDPKAVLTFIGWLPPSDNATETNTGAATP